MWCTGPAAHLQQLPLRAAAASLSPSLTHLRPAKDSLAAAAAGGNASYSPSERFEYCSNAVYLCMDQRRGIQFLSAAKKVILYIHRKHTKYKSVLMFYSTFGRIKCQI